MDAEHIRELFSQFRTVEVRRMFGGVGVSTEGLTFAIAFEGVIYLRANPDMVPELKELGSKPFVYPYAKRMRVRKNPDAAPFWRMPEHLYDDPEQAAHWAGRSLEAARAKNAGNKGKALSRAAPPRKRVAAKSAKKRPAKNAAKAAATKPLQKPPKAPRKKPTAARGRKAAARR